MDVQDERFIFAVAGGASALICKPQHRQAVEHSIVYKEAGRFGGWPANHGIWSWGNEIVVGFRSARFKVMPVGHARDPEKPQDEWQARSTDGGKTWTVEKPPGLTRPENGGKAPVDSPGWDRLHPPGLRVDVQGIGRRSFIAVLLLERPVPHVERPVQAAVVWATTNHGPHGLPRRRQE